MAGKTLPEVVEKNPFDLSLSPNNVRKTVNPKALEQLVMSVVSVLEPIIITSKDQVFTGTE